MPQTLKGGADSTERSWWVPLPVLHEPAGRYWLFAIGVFLIASSVIAAAIVCVRQGLWRFENPPRIEAWHRCECQNRNRLARKGRIEKDLQDSERRLALLNEALTDPSNPAFAGARMAIDAEEKVRDKLRRDRKGVMVEPLADAIPTLVAGLLLITVFAFVAARLAARHGLDAVGPWDCKGKPFAWERSYWSWFAISFVPHAIREVGTSIFSVEKSWFGASSFCISSLAWGLMLVTALGVSMVIAYPASILWQFSSRDHQPTTMDIGHPDGQWGVGRYVLFLQTWSMLCLFFVLLPSALWLRAFVEHPGFSRWYLIPGAVLFLSASVISGRMVSNAVEVRGMYHRKLKTPGASWQEIQARKPPPDPTIIFLGEHWWKLPSIALAVLAALWWVLERIGVSGFLLQLTGFR
jgi:hypothetical protein